jgi:hypothetical protein
VAAWGTGLCTTGLPRLCQRELPPLFQGFQGWPSRRRAGSGGGVVGLALLGVDVGPGLVAAIGLEGGNVLVVHRTGRGAFVLLERAKFADVAVRVVLGRQEQELDLRTSVA